MYILSIGRAMYYIHNLPAFPNALPGHRIRIIHTQRLIELLSHTIHGCEGAQRK